MKVSCSRTQHIASVRRSYGYYREAEHGLSSSSFTYRAAYFISELSVTEVKQVDANKVGIKLMI